MPRERIRIATTSAPTVSSPFEMASGRWMSAVVGVSMVVFYLLWPTFNGPAADFERPCRGA
jgi:hypothetical protein